MQTQPQQSVDKQPKQKRYSLSRLALAAVLIVLFCVLPLILNIYRVIKSSDFVIYLGLFGFAIAIIVVIFDDIIGFVQDKLSDFRRRRHRAVFLISYTFFDHNWAKWIRRQLIQASYKKNEIILRELNTEDNDLSGFKKEIHEASKDAQYIISLVSLEYLEPIRLHEEWYHDFKHRIKQGDLVFINIINTRLDISLVSLPKINLVEAGVDEERARERLINGLPAPLRKRSRSLDRDISADENEDDDIYFPGDLPPVWYFPDSTRFFTGREDILMSLHTEFRNSRLPQALFGIQGIGTTAIAKKYAHRYHGEYSCGLWIHMPPHQEYQEDIRNIGRLLELPGEKGTIDGLHEEIMDWLDKHENWLLILDRCENPTEVRTFIPQRRRGHILLTTPVNALGQNINMISVGPMDEQEGALLLLRRVLRISLNDSLEKASQEDQYLAMSISRETGGFPKVLNLAGVLVKSGMTLSEFFEAYKTQRNKLAEMFAQIDDDDAPTVLQGFQRQGDQAQASAWSVAFEKLKNSKNVAVELLQFCAFFYHDTIPLEIIKKLPALAALDHLHLVGIIMELKKYCLLERDDRTGSLHINPYVQAVLQDSMDNDTKKRLAEQVVQATHSVVYPYFENNSFQELQKYIQHAKACADFILEYNMHFEKAADLLDIVGKYKTQDGNEDAGKYLERALEIRRDIANPQTVGTQA